MNQEELKKLKGMARSKSSVELIEQVERALSEIERLRAEVKRLKLYTNPKLFAAASYVLDVMGQGREGEALEEAMNQLSEAVTWWDSLPFDPEKDAEKLPKYEG